LIQKKFTIFATCFAGIFLFFTGCENSVQTSREPKGITKKVNVSKENSLTELSPVKKEKKRIKQFTYDAGGRVDPFVPLIKEERPNSEYKNKNIKKRARSEGLEKIEISGLKLVAIVRSAGGNKALVQDSKGKGYIVTKGTYIGRNSGKVAEISKQKIIIEEEVKDDQGKISIRKRDLKILRPEPGVSSK
jgi:type IV pilus assembly protein PilP